MANFTLLDYSIEPVNASITPQTAPIISGSIVDEIKITLNYTFDAVFNGELWYNIGLFVEQNQDLLSTDDVPTSGFFITVPNGTTSVQNMGLRGTSESERNGTATFQKTSNNNFTITHTLFLTEDVNNWLIGQGLQNTDRFFKSSTRELNQFQESVNSGYQGGTKNFGFMVSIVRPVTTVSSNNGLTGSSGGQGVQIDNYTADSPIFAIKANAFSVLDKFEIFVNGGNPTASSGVSAGNNYGSQDGFDGNSGAGYPLNSHPATPVIPTPNNWYIGDRLGSFPNRRNEYIADTNDSTISAGVQQQVVWIKDLNVGDIVSVRVAGTGGTAWNYGVHVPEMVTQDGGVTTLHSYVPAELQFINEDATNREFNLSRSGSPVTELATFADTDTDIEIKVDYSVLTLEKIRYSLVNITNENNSTDFLTNYGANFQDAPVPTQVSNTFTTNITIPANGLSENNDYRIVCVGYDETGNEVRAWCSDVLTVTGDATTCPTIELESASNYEQTFTGDAFAVSSSNEIIDTIHFGEQNGSEITAITFDFDGTNFTANRSGNTWTTNDPDWNVTQNGTVVESNFSFVIPDSWKSSSKFLSYTITFGTETASRTHKYIIRANDQDASTPDLTNIELFDTLGNPITDFCTIGENEDIELRLTKDSDYDGRITALGFDDSNQTDTKREASWVGGGAFPQLSDPNISNVDENFTGDVGTFKFKPYQLLTGRIGAITYTKKGVFVRTFRFFSPELNQQTHTATQDETITAINIIGALTSDYTFQINGGIAVDFATIQSSVLSIGDVLTINQTATSFKDSSVNIEFSAVATANPSFSTFYTFPSNASGFGSIDDECIFSFTNKITVGAVTAVGGADMYYAVRTGDYNAENWTSFPFNSIASLNGAIAGISEGTPYSVHVFANWQTTAKGTIQFIASYDTAQKEYIETKDFATLPTFRDLGDAWVGDGVVDYIDIDRTLTDTSDIFDKIWYDKKFSISVLVNVQDTFSPTADRRVFRTLNSSSLPFLISGSVQHGFSVSINPETNYVAVNFTESTYTSGMRTTRIEIKAWYCNLLRDEYNHVVATYDGTNVTTTGAEMNFYLNGRKLENPFLEQHTVNSVPAKESLSIISLSRYYNLTSPPIGGSVDYYFQMPTADVFGVDRIMSSAEIWQVFKNLTNNISEYTNHYPASLLNDMFFHYSLDSGGYTGLQVNDRTGLTTANVIGQVTPDLVSIY